ncbi:MAG TPA: TetR-like C-terminal domain-containing protein [Acidimicrobiia bacterium]|nr:TetR-like C-terminal domain-containing protein [Acidimicrobiia bacterium]
MGRRAGIGYEDVVACATRIADRDGLDAATPSAVAADLGIRTPSLYYHVEGAAGLRRALALHSAGLLTEYFEGAVDGVEGAARIRALATAYRRFAVDHPGLHAALLPAPVPGEDDELYEAMAAPVAIVASGAAGDGLPDAEAIHLIRALRAMLFGFVELEARGGFGLPVDIDQSFEVAVDLMVERMT